MLDHVTIPVTDLAKSQAFYDAALEPLGIARAYAVGDAYAGYAVAGKAAFWIALRDAVHTGVHIAFTAPDRVTVDHFYNAALTAGGRDHGAPGLRPEYHPNYYGAFILDPDGHNIEAVCHEPIA
ncbi:MULTISPECIES: VOC family protein [unclassified Acidisoma]|jgi:catechol 2,3-dioxygenase-like lactoylglutathione lyase family enzyme|uniref:VOC family protein n=1 Tax=unclassified Acidisoma TaxID=2634065 RepID=UPI00131E38C7|nr:MULTISPECIES: VOC family protein [unclassified Acidisoma]